MSARPRVGAAIVLGGFLAGLLAACGAPEERGRVLLLTVDTLRADHLGIHGYDRAVSPFLDELLLRGVIFDRATTPVPRTTPALASLLTGQYPQVHGVRTLTDSLPRSQRSIAEAAGAEGWRTAAIVSNHILTPNRGLGRGFEVYDFAPDQRDARATTRAALDVAERWSEAEKVFLWVHYIDPHVPYHSPEGYATQMDPGYSGRYARWFGPTPGATGDGAYPPDLGKVGSVFRNTLPAEVNAHVRRLYAADIRYTDDAIAELWRGLSASGDSWTVVFTSDHGEALGAHDFYYDHGDYVYEGSLAIPLAIVLPPSHPLHRVGRVDARVSLVDVAPTLADLFGWPLASDFGDPLTGRSLVPHLRESEIEPRLVFAESGRSFYPGEVAGRVRFDVSGRFRAALDERWKLIWTPGREGSAAFQLYDLDHDPKEQRNLYTPAHPEGRRLREALFGWMQAPEGQPSVIDERDAERLRSLGYTE